MDGYEPKDVGEMAKHRPKIRSDYNRYMEQRRKYEKLSGRAKDPQSAVDELKSQMR